MLKVASLALVALLAVLSPAHGQAPTVTSIGTEQFVSSHYMEHPSVAADSLGQPHVVADFGLGADFMKFHRVNGRWSGGVFATGKRGGRYDASRLYIGQIEIDSRDRAWISCKFGVKEFGSLHGQGLWLFRDVSTKPNPAEIFFRFVSVYKGMGVISTDAKYPNEGVMLGTFGNWEKITASGQSAGRGTINGGTGGEKVRFRIASYAPRFDPVPGRTYADGIWHTAMNGYSGMSSKYQSNQRYKAGLAPVTWAEYRAYPRMGDDYCHPGIGIDLDNPRICYIGSVFGNGLNLNVWDGSKMLFNPSSLKRLDPNARFEGRHGTQFAPAVGGGTFVFWTSKDGIRMCYLSQKGVSTAPVYVTAGRSPGVATDRYGNIHLAYFNNGIRYRKIKVSILQAIRPQGRIEGNRNPLFRWTNTKAAGYTLELTRDGVKLPVIACASNSWRPPDDLAVGAYSWRVKEGAPAGKGRWTKSVAFTIPPALSTPNAPTGRFPDAPLRPTFEWTRTDPALNRHVLALYQGGDLLGKMVVTGALTSVRWEERLPAGHYTWRIKSSRSIPGYNISGGWSPMLEFQIAVPGDSTFTQPAALQQFEPGWQTITCAWTRAEGAQTYILKAVYNGTLLFKAPNLATARHEITRTFQPGYYSLFVKAVNADGSGSWSPDRTFIVKRQMLPGDGRTLAGSPRAYQWTRSNKAERYHVKLARYDKSQGRYALVREVWRKQPAAGLTPSWSPKLLLGNGAYRWTVTDYTGKKAGYTSVAYFQVGVPGLPLLLSPAGAAAGHRQLPFAWEDPSGFAQDFAVQVWKDGVKVNTLNWTPAEEFLDKVNRFVKIWNFADDAGGAYSWRVRGRNDKGAGPWRSQAFTLTPLDTPAFTAPANLAFGPAGQPVELAWNPVPGAAHYETQITVGNTVVDGAIVDGTNWLWSPPAAGTYTLQVRAGETGWSRWTDSRLFTAQ